MGKCIDLENLDIKTLSLSRYLHVYLPEKENVWEKRQKNYLITSTRCVFLCWCVSFHLRSLIHFCYSIIFFTAECAKKATLGYYVTTYNPVACYVISNVRKITHTLQIACFLVWVMGDQFEPNLPLIDFPFLPETPRTFIWTFYWAQILLPENSIQWKLWSS